MDASVTAEKGKARQVSLAAIFAASVLSAAGALVFNAFPLFLSTLADQFALSDQQLGFLGTSFLGAFAFVALAALWWLPRLSWKWLGAISYVLIGGSLLGFRAVTPENVFWLMGIYGMGSGIIFTLSLNVLAHARDPDRAYGIKLIFEMALAGLLIFTMTSWLIERFGFSGFIYGTLILYAASAVFVFWIPNKLLQANRQKNQTGGRSNMAAWLASFGLFVQFAAFAGLWGFMERIGAATGATTESVGSILGFSLVAGLGGALAGTWIGNRWGQLRPLVICLLLTIVSVSILISGGTDVRAFAVAAGLINALLQFFLIYQMGLVTEVDLTGRMTMLMAFILALGGALGPGIFGIIKTDTSFDPAYLSVIAICTLTLVVNFFVEKLTSISRAESAMSEDFLGSISQE